MARLTIRLLGPPQFTLGGEPITGFESDKVRALLIYLGVIALFYLALPDQGVWA
jgi:DNA-binding SARP family transcriptional activator